MRRIPAVVASATLVLLWSCLPTLSATDVGATSKSRIANALRNVTTKNRPGQIGLVTIFDGNKYVQCRPAAKSIRCEAAGALMQSSLNRVLVPERIERLTSLGWRLDPSFGNYVQTFAADMPIREIADKVVASLAEGYDASLADLEIQSSWVKDEPCPPRNGPSQNLAGMINSAPQMAATAVHACVYTPIQSATDVVSIYGKRIEAEIKRLRAGTKSKIFFVIQAGVGYVQCAPAEFGAYCEAQSADSWPMLAHVLTPERVARLHAAGFSDPGRSPNYWRVYPFSEFDDVTIARELLTILHEVYGYEGPVKLRVLTEK